MVLSGMKARRWRPQVRITEAERVEDQPEKCPERKPTEHNADRPREILPEVAPIIIMPSNGILASGNSISETTPANLIRNSIFRQHLWRAGLFISSVDRFKPLCARGVSRVDFRDECRIHLLKPGGEKDTQPLHLPADVPPMPPQPPVLGCRLCMGHERLRSSCEIQVRATSSRWNGGRVVLHPASGPPGLWTNLQALPLPSI